MDEMKIQTYFIKQLITKILNTIIRNKLGTEINILINGIEITHADGITNAHLDVRLDISDHELKSLLHNKKII